MPILMPGLISDKYKKQLVCDCATVRVAVESAALLH